MSTLRIQMPKGRVMKIRFYTGGTEYEQQALDNAKNKLKEEQANYDNKYEALKHDLSATKEDFEAIKAPLNAAEESVEVASKQLTKAQEEWKLLFESSTNAVNSMNSNYTYISSQSFPLEDELTFQVNSKYSGVGNVLSNLGISNDVSKSLVTLIQGVIPDRYAGLKTNFSLYNRTEGFQIWNGSDVITVQCRIHLVSHGNALNDVVKPLAALLKCCLPTASKTTGQLLAPGPIASTAFNDVFKNDNPMYKSCYIKIGGMSFYNVIFTQMTPTFGTQVDGNGYPLSAVVNVSFSTLSVATQDTVDAIFGTTSIDSEWYSHYNNIDNMVWQDNT